ncbi:UDP-N-acetylmuramate dehydrogenase [Treponema brennaborense]|uniref:UDP-N-acetylenolpyruvoylglucosamine reductase n=1 Tax=Treponema brennaborense (strain DSM 12168 / CIP 105900 / DD5/3) TaxID=906968 RepID=F4LNQ0_TREBD|nr:UDP-N-acetylmuramate dehydrogenase [Treponema brennaborense]AEE16885.1 UDP-N-acetylenolpyruvoylglucosamine reductase [Treponema brennaborense DSM 12168]
MYNVRKIEENINICGQFRGEILYDEPLAPRTTFKVGGRAAVLAEPADVPSLCAVLNAVRAAAVPYFVLGGGSNVVVPDEGVAYAVVSLQTQLLQPAMNGIELIDAAETSCGAGDSGESADFAAGADFAGPIAAAGDSGKSGDFAAGAAALLRCGAGCTVERVTAFCAEHSLGGLENFAGLPGTVGGAVYMNARCYDRSISDVLRRVSYLDCSSVQPKLCCYEMNGADWDYKKSPFQGQLGTSVIVGAEFAVTRLSAADAAASAKKAASYVADRREKGHFRFPSAGSVFKNNRAFGKPSGAIIDEAGLRGYRIGGAQVAPWHGNFIINTGGATADDIRSLVSYVIRTVHDKTGFTLEPEIVFIPFL